MTRFRKLALVVGAVLCAGVVSAVPTPSDAALTAALPPDPHWLRVLNDYRAQSGLPPVKEDAAYSKGAYAHSCWMLANQKLAHDEPTGTPLYTVEGDNAGNKGNVAVSSVPNYLGASSVNSRFFIELWLTGPYHALGMLRPGLSTVGYGQCQSSAGATWRTGATLNILDGHSAVPYSTPITFPGPNAKIRMTKFIAETPNPLTPCGYSMPAGMPIVVKLPEAPGSVTASLTNPSGVKVPVCALTSANAGDATASKILAYDNAVILVPKDPFVKGKYTASVKTSARTHTWSFDVDPGYVAAAPTLSSTSVTAAGLFTPVRPVRVVDTKAGLGGSKLVAATPTPLQVTGGSVPAGSAAVSVTVTASGSAAAGWLSVGSCATPPTSMVNFAAGQTVSNHVVVALDGTGKLCARSTVAADVALDVTGVYGTTGAKLLPAKPQVRALDTRATATRLAAGSTRRVVLAPSFVTAGMPAAALSVTAVSPSAAGSLVVWGCSSVSDPAPAASTVSFVSGVSRAAAVNVGLASDGGVCVRSTAATDVVIDVTGRFVAAATTGARSTELTGPPVRMVDTREKVANVLNGGTSGSGLYAGRVYEFFVPTDRGVPNASAYTVNVTVVGAAAAGFLTVYGCGTRPGTSTVSFPAGAAVSNTAVVSSAAATGWSFCVWSNQNTHLVVDVIAVHR